MKMQTFVLFSLLCATAVNASLMDTTCDRIRQHGYPCENHTVQTSDGYELTLFRIPYSPNLNNPMDFNKSAVLIMHGLLSSSDGFVLNGPNDALSFILSDAGYDVWLGNSRGNDYSQRHIYKSPLLPSFWSFSWHEIGAIDIPAKIDYILEETGQKQLHYIGHSQGGTTFFVMLSTHPNYNSTIKTSHLLAPAVYMENIDVQLANILELFALDQPSGINNLISLRKLPTGNDLLNRLLPPICKLEKAQDWCNNVLAVLDFGPSKFVNQTLLSALFETHPADCSLRQLLHYLQVRESKEFRSYDYGRIKNLAVYGSSQPPNYPLQNVNTVIPICLYYSDNDAWVALQDIDRLASELGPKVTLHHVKYPEFNHIDFLFARNIKEVIYDCVLDQINKYEGKQFLGNQCNNVRDAGVE